eukprot:scaffold1588_cov40-Attheya_sp.AAC.2
MEAPGTSLRATCCPLDASITAAVTIDVMGGDGFVDISLVEAPALKRGGCGACGKRKGGNGGKRGETVFWGDTKPVVVVCGAAGWCRACGKGTNGGKWDKTVFWGDTKPVVVCGAAVGERVWTE